MKVSVVTVCFNAAATIVETLESVAMQRHPDVEHIVIDGNSKDGTQDLVRTHGAHVAKFVSEPDRGLYDAMNKGIALASGEVIAFLNSDDVYTNADVLSRVHETMSDPAVDACYANLIYVDRIQSDRVVRVWRSRDFQPGLFRRGWMPAHPTLFVRRRVFEEFGGFDLTFRRQADFDLMLRFFEIAKVRSRFVPETWVRMRAGGLSNNGLTGMVRGNLEAWQSCKKNGLDVPPWFMLQKAGSRLTQLLPGAIRRAQQRYSNALGS
jgi:glycosyltransferase involved in cell wall biosynthesis